MVDLFNLNGIHACIGVVDLVTLNEFHFVSSMFTLKAATPKIASSWTKGIQQAQVR